jgi:Zn-dependent M32 family carboxypeptidase
MINFKDQFDDGSEVKKKFHYNKDTNEGRTLMTQEEQIEKLLGEVKKNSTDINRYKNAIVELQRSMNNIQSVDREIYKQLKNLSNRDQELLDRATAALARGASREEVAAILERIIS